jgi:hypothetical protein
MSENEKSWDILYDKYPFLFQNRHKTPMESCMSFGIECSIGWYEILSSLCWEIKQHEENIKWQREWQEKQGEKIEKEYQPVQFDQVKEKFGGLRIYFSGGDEYVEGLVRMAEGFSYKICELCGSNEGRPNKEGWIATLCEKCRPL